MTRHDRRSVRLQGYDYSQAGAYFITICTHSRECLFGKIVGGQMQLNEWGMIVENCWREIRVHFPGIELDTYVVMPNHVHGVIRVVGARHAVPLQSETFGKPVPGSVPTIIRSFKSAATKQINELRQTPGISIWQRNYYERMIRIEHELNNVRQYILDNPLKWETDPENPAALRDSLLPRLMSGKIGVK